MTRAHTIASSQDALACFFKQAGDVRILVNRRLGEMPDAPIRLVVPQLGQRSMRGAALDDGGQVDHGRADHRVAEGQPMRGWLNEQEPGLSP